MVLLLQNRPQLCLGWESILLLDGKSNSDALQVVGQMIERGEIQLVIEAAHPLDEIIAAHTSMLRKNTQEGRWSLPCPNSLSNMQSFILTAKTLKEVKFLYN